MSYKAAVLTISDTASASPLDLSLDTSRPFITAQLLALQPPLVQRDSVKHALVSDDEDDIRKVVRQWVDEGLDLIITTGGTGWGRRDLTAKALNSMFTKPLPSLSQALTTYGLSKTPLAALSNPTCGIISSSSSSSQTLVVALPGSKGGVKDGMAVLGPILSHGLSVLGNRDSSQSEVEDHHGPRILQDRLEHASNPPRANAHTCHHNSDHGHNHHRHHLKPDSAVSARQRQSPHPMISLTEALQTINKVIDEIDLGTQVHHIDSDIAGHVIAEEVKAEHPLPQWHSTNVDGYAVYSEDGPGDYQVRPRGSGTPLKRGQIERVNTGGPIPQGADTVIMVEDTELISASASGEELVVRILPCSALKGSNVRLPGSDIPQGEIVMALGDLITRGGGEVGVLSSIGKRTALVRVKPKIAILSTGSELVDLSLKNGNDQEIEKGGWGGIYDCNRPSLKSVITGLGYEVIDLGVVKDEIGAHEDAMRRALEVADVVITTGGTSMGEGDLVKPLLEHTFNATIHFGRVSMAPGKPTTFASIPVSTSESDVASSPSPKKKVFFALPGNPASALVTFWVFVLPALKGLSGWPKDLRGLRPIWVELTHPLPKPDRPTYHRCILSYTSSGLPQVTSTGGQRSSRVASLKGAEVLVLVKAGETGVVEKGERVEGLVLPL